MMNIMAETVYVSPLSQTGFQLAMYACKATIVQDGRRKNSSTNEDAHKHIYIVRG